MDNKSKEDLCLYRYAREKSDYEDGYIVSNEKAKEQLDSSKELIELVEKYLNKRT